MQVSKLKIDNFRGIKSATLDFDGHTLLVGHNNVGKSTICEALELALGSDRQNRFPPVEEFDFYNAGYWVDGKAIPIIIEVWLTNVTPLIEKSCGNYLDRWDPVKRRILTQGEVDAVDGKDFVWCLRLKTIARYNEEEDEFEASTHYAKIYDPNDEGESKVSRTVRRNFGFLYLRALRTGSRALSLERGSLLDVILRMQSLQTGIWETVRDRMEKLDPPIDEGAAKLSPVMQSIETRLAEYIRVANPGKATRLFVSQLTREHLRKTLSFFLSMSADQKPVPFQDVGTGTLNTLVLALLSFIAELKGENVIFAMEEPEIALPPHTQRRIASYLLTKTTQCFVTSHSPYVIESFEPDQISILRRDDRAEVTATKVVLGEKVKAKTYRKHIRRALAEAMLGRGVVLTEGFTEPVAFAAVAAKLEAANDELYPLDLSGITIMSTDGDGSIAEFSRFFSSLDIPTFGFLDLKKRNAVESKALEEAGFTLFKEAKFKGLEDLVASEVPTNRQWEYLGTVRDAELTPDILIPAGKPSDAEIQDFTKRVLKSGKGAGLVGDLIDMCQVGDLGLPPEGDPVSMLVHGGF